MTEQENKKAITKARIYSTNKNKVDGFYNGYCQATKENEKFKSDYHELCRLKDVRIAELEAQIEKMKRCEICKHYRWNHCSYEINISKDCIQNKLKHFELKEITEK